MSRRVLAAVMVAVLALGAGVAYADTQSTASGATNVCVNDTNGLMRVDTTCRDAEHALTIGGGGSGQVTQSGTFTVPADETGAGKVLPLTGVTVSGRCLTSPSPFPGFPGGMAALFRVEAATGTTMDIFGMGGQQSPVDRSSAEFSTQGGVGPGMTTGNTGTGTAIVTSNDATATITVGGYADRDAGTCTYLWQATEAPN
jgi:hypothetical protein